MRICIIPPDQKAAHPDHISSGQERVARDQARLLAQAGHQVDYWTVNTEHDLSPLGFTHRIMEDIQPRVFFNSSRPNPQTKPKREWCRQHYTKYDIFLCHTDSSVFLKELVRLGVGHRIISFIHAPFAGTMWGIGFNSGQGRARWGGATIVAVSERCKNHWNKWSSSTKKRLESHDPGYISRPDLLNKDVVFEDFVTEVLCPQYSTTTDEVLHGSTGPLVLSRIAAEKKIHIAFGLEATFVCRSDNKKYLEKIQGKLKTEIFHVDRPYSECMDYLRHSSVLLSTWTDETSGINAFEAAERGVPVILCESGAPHASREFLPDWAFITCEDNHAALAEALSKVPTEWKTMAFRRKLAEHMRSVWSEAAYSKKLNDLVQRVHARIKDLPVQPREFGGDLVEPIGEPPIKKEKVKIDKQPIKKEPKAHVEKKPNIKSPVKQVAEPPTDIKVAFEQNGFEVVPADGSFKKVAFIAMQGDEQYHVIVQRGRWGLKAEWQEIPNALLAVGYDGKVWIAPVTDCVKKVEHTGTWQNKKHYNAGEPKAPLFTPL